MPTSVPIPESGICFDCGSIRFIGINKRERELSIVAAVVQRIDSPGSIVDLDKFASVTEFWSSGDDLSCHCRREIRAVEPTRYTKDHEDDDYYADNDSDR